MPEERTPYQTPTCNPVESLPSYPWDALLRRLEGIGRQLATGTHKVTFSVMVHNGKPVQWFRPDIKTLEPKASGRQFLDLLENGEALVTK